jgi:hypothetical protein
MGQRRSFFWYFALLGVACVFALLFSPNKRLFVFQLPLLLAFGWSGSSAFVLAAVLAGIWELLREPMGELSADRRYERPGYAGGGLKGLLERLKPFRVNCLLILFFAAFFAIFSLAAGLSPIPAAAVLLSFGLLYFLAFRAESERIRKSRHVPFTPVPLLPFKVKTFSLFPLLLPFGAASALALFLSIALPNAAPSREEQAPVDFLVSSDDYYRHLDFQRTFSYRPLGQQALNQDSFLRYYLGEDGLIAGSTNPSIGSWMAAPFPLEKLMDFLLNYSNAPGRGFGVSWASLSILKELIAVAIIFAALILDLLPSAIRPGTRPLLWNLSRMERRFPS